MPAPIALQPILSANAATSVDLITFNISGPSGGVRGNAPLSALPSVTDAVTIDGWTQPGFAAPLIELNGANAGASANGLFISVGRSTVRGLIINRFGDDGIEIFNGTSNAVIGCYIGTNAAGTAAMGNGLTSGFGSGVTTNGALNRIGTDGNGTDDTRERNVISGNPNGVSIAGTLATDNVVAGNYIGTDAQGLAAVPNRIGVAVF